MKSQRKAVAVVAILFALGVALIARREPALDGGRDTQTLQTNPVPGTANEVPPVDAAPPSSAAGGVEPEACRQLDMEVANAIQQNGRVALDPVEARGRLLTSQDPEHLATAALLSREPADRVADISRAMAVGRGNATIAWTAMQICVGAGPDAACPAREWEAALLELDAQNSEVWIQVAETRWQRGEIPGALGATQRAAAAAETRTYWADTGTYYGEVIGQSIQISALEASGQDASEVIARRDRGRRERDEAARHAGEVVVTTPAQYSGWLTTLREKGERAAQGYLVEKANLYRSCAGEKQPERAAEK